MDLVTSDGGIEHVVDTDRYPLADQPGRSALVARARRELRGTGCCVLPDFVRPELRETLRLESGQLADRAYHHVETVNVYNTEPDPTLPPGHPARTTMERGNAFVARDEIPERFVVHRLYASPLFRRLVADCFGRSEVHELADPLSGLVLNVVSPGRSHPWHFDVNELTVSMLTQGSEGGGVFEYCPNIRTAQEENVDDVRAVLDGRDSHPVRRLTLRPGDLQLFLGRYSLHRVTPVRGTTSRHSAIFAYSERPGVVGTIARTRQLFGRVAEQHLAAADRAVRVDQLMD
ncbi:MAG: arpA protein [Pseudonocardia sp.]|nr:arpA protein [Pseudonocardia sp.]